MSTPDGFRIEPVTVETVPDLLALIRALADYEHLAGQVAATVEGLREGLFAAPPAADAVFATIDGRKIGYAIWFPTFSTFLGRRGIYLEDLFVVPEWRGQGVGRALLAHVARVALARGEGRMEWAVLNWNEPAIEFYRRLGARPMHGWTVYRLDGQALKNCGGVTAE